MPNKQATGAPVWASLLVVTFAYGCSGATEDYDAHEQRADSENAESAEEAFRSRPRHGGNGSSSGGNNNSGGSRDPSGPPDLSDFGAHDVPSGQLPPITGNPDTRCDAQFDPVIEDGEIVALEPLRAQPGCAVDYCHEVTDSLSGQTTYPSASGAVLSSELPIPTAAITEGCPAIEAAAACPILSNGEQAAGCEAEPAEADCDTITVCPDPDAFPEDPRDFREVTRPLLTRIDNLFPDNITEAVPGAILNFLDQDSPLYINPCEWDDVLNTFSYGFDVSGRKGGVGASCTSNSECNSDNCYRPDEPGILYGTCTHATTTTRFELEEGNDTFGIRLRAGLDEGRAQIKRAAFFPSTEFDVRSRATAHARGRVLGRTYNFLRMDLESELSECGYDFQWSNSTDGDDFATLGELIVNNLEQAGVVVEIDVSDAAASASTSAVNACENALSSLHQAERQANEAFHDALIASTYYNLTGGGGLVIGSRADAQAYVDTYDDAVDNYRSRLANFEAAQQAALDHTIDAELLNFQTELNHTFNKTFGIGPFNPNVEIGVFGRVGFQDVQLRNSANTHFTDSATTPCDGQECMTIEARAAANPHAAVGVFAFVGGGFDLGLVGGWVRVRGELDLINARVPLVGSFKLTRTKQDGRQVVTDFIDRQLNAEMDTLTPTQRALISGLQVLPTFDAFKLDPVVAQFNASVMLGGRLVPVDGTVSADVSFLSGRIDLQARAKLFPFGSKRFKKTLFQWDGRGTEWFLASPNAQAGIDSFDLPPSLVEQLNNPLVAELGMLPAPNMVLLPELAVLPDGSTGSLDRDTASAMIQRAFDTQEVHGRLMPHASHTEDMIGRPWTPASAGGRCRYQDPIR